jgi:hypothetical protein
MGGEVRKFAYKLTLNPFKFFLLRIDKIILKIILFLNKYLVYFLFFS